MRFAIASEGKTDYVVLKNLLIGFFKDKSLPVTALRPKDNLPFGWGNLMNYISSSDFKDVFDDENTDCVIVQIDTNECEEWKEGVKHIGVDSSGINVFAEKVADVLAKQIGNDFYDAHKEKIIFAICVHEIECWLLPFNASRPAHQKKMVGCANAIEQMANKNGFSIHEKNYEGGKHFDTLSKSMRDNKELMHKGKLNPSLNSFINALSLRFPVDNPASE